MTSALSAFLATYLPAKPATVAPAPSDVYNFTWTRPTKEQPECPF